MRPGWMLVWTSQLCAAVTEWVSTWVPVAQRHMHNGSGTFPTSLAMSRLAALSPCSPTACHGGSTSVALASALTQVSAAFWATLHTVWQNEGTNIMPVTHYTILLIHHSVFSGSRMIKYLGHNSLLSIQELPAACSSSLMAFNDAMTDLTTGRIDYAVVGGASGIFRPQTSIAFQRLHMMSPDVRSLTRVLCTTLTYCPL